MELSEKPTHIKQAVILIAISLFVGLLKVAHDYEFLLSIGPIQGTVLTMAFTISIMLFLAYKIWLGRNWARITLTLLFIMGLYPVILLMPAEAERSILVLVGSVLQTALQLAAIVLIFLPASNNWFKSVKAVKNA